MLTGVPRVGLGGSLFYSRSASHPMPKPRLCSDRLRPCESQSPPPHCSAQAWGLTDSRFSKPAAPPSPLARASRTLQPAAPWLLEDAKERLCHAAAALDATADSAPRPLTPLPLLRHVP